MADVITRLKLESVEYDSKIKRATQGLLQMEQECRKAGKSMNDMEKDNRQFVQSLGSMQTVSTTVRGKIGELSGAFVELRSQYNRLTDEEKKGDFGKALSGSLDQLKIRVAEAKAELRSINAELENTGKGGGGDGMIARLKDKMGGAVQVFAGNMMTQAANGIQETISQSIQLAQATEGVEAAFNRLNRPDLLDQLKEATHGTVSELNLMKAAVQFNDFGLPVEELGTMLAFAQQKAKDTGQSVDYLVNSIVTGLGRKSKLILDNLGISGAEIDKKMAETGDMTKAVGEIIREQMQKAGDYVETASDRAARAAAEQQNAMARLGKELMPIAGIAANVFSTIRVVITSTIGVVVKYHGVILAASAGMGAYALVVNRATIATKAHAAATKVAEVAQKALNLAQKASPIGLVVAGITAATTAIVAFASKSSEASAQEEAARRVRIQQMQRERAERDRLAQRAKAEADAISAATGENMAKYEMLRNEWAELQTEQQKNTFIKNNANLFSELGLSINSSADAMKAFVTNSAKVIEALDSMAKAEALKDLLKDAYKQQYSTPSPDRSQYRPTTDEMVAYAPSTLQRTWRTGFVGGGFKEIPQEEIDRHIDQYINSQGWAKQAGINRGDFRVSTDNKSGEIRFSLNAAGASKMTDYRQQTGTQKIQDENNANVERLKNLLDTTTQESLKKRIEAGVFTIPGITTPTKGDTTTSELTKTQKIQQQINKLADEAEDATDERRKKIREEVAELQKQLDARKKIREEVLGINDESKKQEDLQKKITEAVKERSEALAGNNLKAFYAADSKVVGAGGASIAANGFTATEDNIAAFIENLKAKIGQADVGTTLHAALTSQLRDTEAFKSIIEKAVKNGITTADFNQNEIWKKIFTENGNIPNETWRGLLKSINDELLKAGFEPIKLTATVDYSEKESDGSENSDVENNDGKNTKSNSKKKSKREEDEDTDKKNQNKKDNKIKVNINPESLSQLTGGISSMVSGIEQLGVKVPDGLKNVISALQGITTILTAIQTISSVKFWSNGGIVHAAAGIIVPGNHFSGDLVPSMINSGELILNRSQQNALAHQLSENSQQGVDVQPFVDGEKIFLGMNNTSRRMGRGEIVTTSTLRRLGLI